MELLNLENDVFGTLNVLTLEGCLDCGAFRLQRFDCIYNRRIVLPEYRFKKLSHFVDRFVPHGCAQVDCRNGMNDFGVWIFC